MKEMADDTVHRTTHPYTGVIITRNADGSLTLTKTQPDGTVLTHQAAVASMSWEETVYDDGTTARVRRYCIKDDDIPGSFKTQNK